jgi:starch phosphorylase
LIGKFEPFVENPQVRKSFQAIKESNKLRLAELVEKELGIALDPTALFTVQAKRFHEYKRQTLNVFGCIHRYLKIKAMTPSERKKVTPHVAFFAGKAAPGYAMAKLMIQLINNVGRVVNNDREVGDLFKVVMLADYSVSLAEVLMPAADLSVQISTAGVSRGRRFILCVMLNAEHLFCQTEASGTGNMKLSINGALMLGT